jgi:hypothetical protein
VLAAGFSEAVHHDNGGTRSGRILVVASEDDLIHKTSVPFTPASRFVRHRIDDTDYQIMKQRSPAVVPYFELWAALNA